MRSVLSLRLEPPQPDRAGEFEDGECYPESLVERFLEEYTRPGDLVLDPFAGSGTTLVVAERMGRRPLGFEIHPERVAIVASRLQDPTAIRQGDVRLLDPADLPSFDLVMTSPPYMTNTGHLENPLSGYRTLDGDYRAYVEELTSILERLGRNLTDGGRIVVNVANLDYDGAVTPLAFDLGHALSRVLTFEREVVLDWDPPIEWLTNDYCLIFTAKGDDVRDRCR
ncbi:MAG TPA: DNA methyltransferase [Actinopolymorphaceae bacterium]